MTAKDESECLERIVFHLGKLRDHIDADPEFARTSLLGKQGERFDAESERMAALIEMELLQAGEECKGLSQATRDRMRRTDVRGFAGLSDLLRHGYFGIDGRMLWKCAVEAVSELLPEVERELSERCAS